MNTLLLATNNRHKVIELRALTSGHGMTILTPAEIGLELDVEETGSTFADNARLKATAFLEASGYSSLADDSGLEVDALGGEPGIRSARYGGPDLDDRGRLRLVLDKMQEVPETHRQARFTAAIALAVCDQPVVVFQASVYGRIAGQAQGTEGFGYDPIFYYPPFGRTFAEVSRVRKATVSHRGQAMRQALDYLIIRLDAGILSGEPKPESSPDRIR